MSRISRLDCGEVTPKIAVLYDKAFAQRDNVPNMFRMMAHRPEIFITMQAHFGAILNTGTVPAKLKDLIIVGTRQVNETPSGWNRRNSAKADAQRNGDDQVYQRRASQPRQSGHEPPSDRF
jgi:alkylhydroperoxidase family enzyme